MNFEALLKPISPDTPCGPDLNKAMDPEYEDYYFSALGRLPDFFVQPGVERPDESKTPDRYFDSKTVNFSQESSSIKTLLERTRDIRLLTLMAQWESLTSRFSQMADTIDGLAQLLSIYPEDVHPTLEGGTSERRDALEELNQSATIIQPLMFMELCGSDEVTLRKIQVANGKGTPLDNENDLNASEMMSALGAESNRDSIEKIYAYLIKISTAIQSIESTCQSKTSKAFTPDLDRLKGTLSDLLETLIAAHPNLGQMASSQGNAEGLDGVPSGNPYDMQLSVKNAGINIANIPRPTVIDHEHAKQLLEACESYFCTHEPSSGALVLITQARLLIGKPLVEAIRTLLPQKATNALVDFGEQTGFRIDAERLYQLTQEATNAQQQRQQNVQMQEAQRQQQLAAEERQRQIEEERRRQEERQAEIADDNQETDGEEVVDEGVEMPESESAVEVGAEAVDKPIIHDTLETPQNIISEPQAYPSFFADSPESALVATIAVEEYFSRKERSSPVPVLLQRARNYMNMDFQALIKELIPDQEQQ